MKSGQSIYSPGEFQRRGALRAPVSYWCAPVRTRAANCNGCGTSGWKGALVPDTVYGLPITDACQIHDWMYAEGQTSDDKGEADAVFLENLLGLVEAAAKASLFARVIAPFRRRRCLAYFEAVNAFGDDAFAAAELVRSVKLDELTAVASELRLKATWLDQWLETHRDYAIPMPSGRVEREAADLLDRLAQEIAA